MEPSSILGYFYITTQKNSGIKMMKVDALDSRICIVSDLSKMRITTRCTTYMHALMRHPGNQCSTVQAIW